ncbi:hypothetical protein XACJM35_2650004 [Xanthomonas citri pv. citri]|nr:hypothetical protein XACJM35_2650004 [Xanthomonas citri pv. citri]
MPRQPRPSRLQVRETAQVVSFQGRVRVHQRHPQGTSPLRAGNPLFVPQGDFPWTVPSSNP